MPGHSRSKNGVASLAYGAGHPRLTRVGRSKTWMAGTSPAMTEKLYRPYTSTSAADTFDIMLTKLSSGAGNGLPSSRKRLVIG
jgi:hypothetical protein